MLTLEQWNIERGKLLSSIAAINTAMNVPWSRVPFTKRCNLAVVAHNNECHILQGWDGISNNGLIYGDNWRTADLEIVEKSSGSIPGRCFHSAASFNGSIFLGPGYDGTLPGVAPDDQVTNSIYSSVDGVMWTQRATPPWEPREAGLFMVHEGYLYMCHGLKYTWNPYTLYQLSDAWRTADGDNWEQLSVELGFPRRSMGFASWAGAIVMIGGYNDPEGFTHADARRSTDGLQTFPQVATDLPFGPRAGHSLVVFRGRLVVLGGTKDEVPKIYYNSVWSTDDPMMQNANWVQHAVPPWAARSAFGAVVLSLGGVETLCIFGGKGSGVTHGDAWQTTDLSTWTRLSDSDLDVA